MKISGIDLTKGRLPIVVGAITVVVAISIYVMVYAPLLSALKAKYLECRASEAQVFDARHIIESAGKMRTDRMLLTEKDTSLAIDELTKHGKEMGINFVSIRPKDIIAEKSSRYKILPIGMEIDASDEQFAAFVGTLDELTKSLIVVKSFDITPDKDNRKRLHADIVIHAYFSGREIVNAE